MPMLITTALVPPTPSQTAANFYPSTKRSPRDHWNHYQSGGDNSWPSPSYQPRRGKWALALADGQRERLRENKTELEEEKIKKRRTHAANNHYQGIGFYKESKHFCLGTPTHIFFSQSVRATTHHVQSSWSQVARPRPITKGLCYIHSRVKSANIKNFMGAPWYLVLPSAGVSIGGIGNGKHNNT